MDSIMVSLRISLTEYELHQSYRKRTPDTLIHSMLMLLTKAALPRTASWRETEVGCASKELKTMAVC
jgi:hypothetical protein